MASKNKKRYFWLKLNEGFFNQKEIKMLRRIAGGDTYTVIYLKMLLKSLQTDGKMYYEGVSSDFVEEIALDIDEDYENVSITVQFLKSKGLLVDSGVDEVELVSVQKMVGSETSDAERQRRKRERDKLQIETERDNVTPVSRLGHVEIELEKEIDIEIEQETETAAATLINKLSATLAEYRIEMNESDVQGLVHEIKKVGQDVDFEQVVFMYVDGLQYAITNKKTRPVAYALTRLSENIKDGYTSLKQIQDKESVRNAETVVAETELPDVAWGVDIANTDWSKY